MVETEPKPLSPAQRQAVYSAIHKNMAPDDRWPSEVIDDSFGGNEQRYLKTMAGWHGVNLGK